MNNQTSTDLIQPFIKGNGLENAYLVVYEVGRYDRRRKAVKFLITNDVNTIANYVNQKISYHRYRMCFNITEAYNYLSTIVPEDTYPDYGITDGLIRPNTVYNIRYSR